MTVYSPFIFWAQSEKNIYLKVDLKDVKEPHVTIKKRKLLFSSKGHGAQGFQKYEFSLDFNSDINTEESIYKVTDHKIVFTFTKEKPAWWPRLISQLQKPAWIKIDFDKWQSEDLDDEQVNDVRDDYREVYDKLQKEEMGYRNEDFKKVYLTLYNLFMYVGFMYVVSVLVIRWIRDGYDCFPGTYEAVGPAICFLQLTQFLEVMHPMFGYVKGGVMMPLMQISGRLFVLFLMIENEPRIQKMPVVTYLLLTWSAIEIIRYPFYMSQLHKRENGLLTWLRYTAWIFLYPIGFFCEGVIVFRNLIYAEQNQKWSISMPNKYNFTFHFPSVLRIYLLFILLPASYTLMSYMYKARQMKLGSKRQSVKFRKQ